MVKSSRRRHRGRSPSSSTSSSTDTSDTSTDHEFFNHQLSRLGLYLRAVPSDGNCLFSAFSDQLYGTMKEQANLRRKAVTYLRTHRPEMRPFCDEASYDNMLKELAEPGAFGDHISLVALARLFHVDVVVHRHNEPPRLVASGCTRAACQFLPHAQVHLAFHEDEMHYSSVRRSSASNYPNTPADVFLDLDRLGQMAHIQAQESQDYHRQRRSHSLHHHNHHRHSRHHY